MIPDSAFSAFRGKIFSGCDSVIRPFMHKIATPVCALARNDKSFCCRVYCCGVRNGEPSIRFNDKQNTKTTRSVIANQWPRPASLALRAIHLLTDVTGVAIRFHCAASANRRTSNSSGCRKCEKINIPSFSAEEISLVKQLT